MNAVMPKFTEAQEICHAIGWIIPDHLDLWRDKPMTRDEYLTLVSETYQWADEILQNGRCLSTDVKESLESVRKVAMDFIERSLSVQGFKKLKSEYN